MKEDSVALRVLEENPFGTVVMHDRFPMSKSDTKTSQNSIKVSAPVLLFCKINLSGWRGLSEPCNKTYVTPFYRHLHHHPQTDIQREPEIHLIDSYLHLCDLITKKRF